MAGQDIKKLIPAGGGFPVNVGGEYIYLKFADRPIDVIINGGRSGQTRVTMEAGDKYRPGSFPAFEIINTDPDNPAQVIFTVGEGDYNRQIVQGNITVVPGIQKASGEFVDDTRWNLAANVTITNATPKTFSNDSQFEFVNTTTGGNITHLCLFLNENLMIAQGNSGGGNLYDLTTEARLTSVGDEIGNFDTFWNGTLDKNGNTWIAGRNKTTGDVAALRIDANRNILEVRQSNRDEDNWLNNSATTCVGFDDQNVMYLFVPDTGPYVSRVYRWIEATSTFISLGRIDKSAEFWVARHLSIQQQDGQNYAVWSRSGSSNAYGAFLLDDDSLTQIGGGSFINFEHGGMEVKSQRIYWRAEATTDFRAYNNQTWTRTAQGIFKTCAGSYLFKGDEQQTEAQLTAEEDSQGRVTVAGELIRAMLELYLADFVADDYLDHVYSVTFDNEGGRAPRTISAGNKTFEGAKIADDFNAVFPQNVTITLDNGLKAKG